MGLAQPTTETLEGDKADCHYGYSTRRSRRMIERRCLLGRAFEQAFRDLFRRENPGDAFFRHWSAGKAGNSPFLGFLPSNHNDICDWRLPV